MYRYIYIRSLSCTSGVQLPSPQLITRLLGQPISTVTSCTERNGRLENKKKTISCYIEVFHSLAHYKLLCSYFQSLLLFFFVEKKPSILYGKKTYGNTKEGLGLIGLDEIFISSMTAPELQLKIIHTNISSNIVPDQLFSPVIA